MSNLRSTRSLINAPAVPPLTCNRLSKPVTSLRTSARRQFNYPSLHITKDGDHGAPFESEVPAPPCLRPCLPDCFPIPSPAADRKELHNLACGTPRCRRGPLYRAQVYLGPFWLSISCCSPSRRLLRQPDLRKRLQANLPTSSPSVSSTSSVRISSAGRIATRDKMPIIVNMSWNTVTPALICSSRKVSSTIVSSDVRL